MNGWEIERTDYAYNEINVIPLHYNIDNIFFLLFLLHSPSLVLSFDSIENGKQYKDEHGWIVRLGFLYSETKKKTQPYCLA